MVILNRLEFVLIKEMSLINETYMESLSVYGPGIRKNNKSLKVGIGILFSLKFFVIIRFIQLRSVLIKEFSIPLFSSFAVCRFNILYFHYF